MRRWLAVLGPALVVGVALLMLRCSAAQQAAEVKVAVPAIRVSLEFCRLDVEGQPSTPGWEALICQLDEATAAALGVTTTQAVVPAGTMARLALAADGGGG